jgi:hypothetical protein
MAVPHRDDVNIPASLGPGENHHSAVKKSRSVLAHFAIVEAIIEPSRVIALEYLGRVGEIEAPMGKVAARLAGSNVIFIVE